MEVSGQALVLCGCFESFGLLLFEVFASEKGENGEGGGEDKRSLHPFLKDIYMITIRIIHRITQRQ